MCFRLPDRLPLLLDRWDSLAATGNCRCCLLHTTNRTLKTSVGNKSRVQPHWFDTHHKVQVNNNARRAIVESIVGVYAERFTRAEEKEEVGSLETMPLLRVAQFYKVWRGNVSIRSKKAVVKTTPWHSSNPASPKYCLYCKYNLMKFKPWRGNFLQSLGVEEEQEEDVLQSMFIDAWKEFVRQQVSLSYVAALRFYKGRF